MPFPILVVKNADLSQIGEVKQVYIVNRKFLAKFRARKVRIVNYEGPLAKIGAEAVVVIKKPKGNGFAEAIFVTNPEALQALEIDY